MELTIDGKNYTLRFGFAAIDYLDNMYPLKTQGIEVLGQGVGQVYSMLNSESIIALMHAIKAGTITENQIPSTSDIEKYLMDLGEKNKLEKLFKDIIAELKKQPLTKGTISKFDKAVKEAMETK